MADPQFFSEATRDMFKDLKALTGADRQEFLKN